MSIKNTMWNTSWFRRFFLFLRNFLFRRNFPFRILSLLNQNTTFRTQMWAVLAIITQLVMESTPIALWYQALFVPAGVSWTGIFTLVLAVIGASLLMLLAMQRFHWKRIARQAVFIAWLLFAAFASLKWIFYPRIAVSIPELVWMPVQYIIRSDVNAANFYHLVVIFLLVWRGVSLGRGPVNLSGVQGSFQAWLAMLLLYGMLFAPRYPVQAAVGLYLFLFCGLVAMSSARLATMSQARGGRITRFGFGWMASILLSALALVGLSILVSWMLGGTVVQVLAIILIFILALLTGLVLLLLSPLLKILADMIPRLVELLQQILARLRSIPYIEQLARLISTLTQDLQKIVPYIMAARSLILLGVLVVLILVIVLALYFRGSQARSEAEEESGSIEPGAEDNPLQKLLKRLLRGARSIRGRRPGQILAAARVRHIYRQLMALSKKLGGARPASVTPLEFLPALAGLFPGEDASLDEITRAYLKVRYGEFPETRQEVESVEAAWKSVRQKARKQG